MPARVANRCGCIFLRIRTSMPRGSSPCCRRLRLRMERSTCEPSSSGRPGRAPRSTDVASLSREIKMRANTLLRAFLILAPSVACLMFYLPTLSGGFLSDDYAVLGALDAWRREGRLGGALLSKFVSGLDAPSYYYRPLSMLSFGANFLLWGAAPYAWRLTNLVFHIASGALLFAIAHRLVDGRGGV